MQPAPLFLYRICFTAAVTLAPLVVPVNAEEALPQVERLKSSPVLRHLKANPLDREAKSNAERTVAQMYVPEGFKVEVVAAEPDVHQPIAFAWDYRGRIWVAEAYSYPTKRPAGEGLDKIIILADEDGDGRFESRKVFAEKLNLVSAIEVGHGGVWVGAAPELLFIPDRDGDDRPDGAPEVLLDGFGYQDTHETLNSFLWGPDGWLYGIQGVFNTARIGKPGVPSEQRPELRAGVWRYHPVRREFEIFAHGGSNPWGLDYDEHGQLFMTHCRSYWGRGLTTHVIQGGQFWNQVNANYAPFIVANPPREYPAFRNYLLASARYDHGAGGAGVRGSDAIYGGHSHVGTMIYLGDNWPDEFRGRLFTHNLGGHQINQQINKPLGSGYDTVHAGRDMLFCTDPKYVAVDLQYGPDGAVYFIDWYDQQHCHNPNTERWDRGNGRLYRMQWQSGFKPVKVNLAAKSDTALIQDLAHRNHWYRRMATRLLGDRSQSRTLARTSMAELGRRATEMKTPVDRLQVLWALHAVSSDFDSLGREFLADSDPFVRAWAVQLLLDDKQVSSRVARQFILMAGRDPSPVVRRYLASAMSRLDEGTSWAMARALATREEDRDDRNLPFLVWHGLGQHWADGRLRVDRAFTLARETKWPQLADWIHWFTATLEGEPTERAVASLKGVDDETLRRRLAGLWLALEPRADVRMPGAWKSVAPALYAHRDVRVQRQSERIAAAFGDDTAFPRLRQTLAATNADAAARQHAFAVLSRASDRASLPVFLRLLDEAAFRAPAIKLLTRFDSPEIAPALLERFAAFNPAERAAALDALTSRPAFALALLDAVASKRLQRDQLTAFHVRQLSALKNAEVDQRIAGTWGRINQTPAGKQAQIARLEKQFTEAPLWAYSANAGREQFQKLCAQCHRLGNDGVRLGPELTGAGKHGILYYLENIIDPDAVIGTDFQMTTIETKDGETISGLLVNETASAVTLRTTVGESVVPKSNIGQRTRSEKSLMPEGLIDSLGEREKIELLKFLTGN